MQRKSPFHETDPDRVLDVFEAHPLALIVTSSEAGPRTSQAPVLVDRDPRRLRFHLSARNPAVQDLTANPACLIIALGPNTYVSPDWYGRENQVPTWNYVSAQAAGVVEALDVEGAEAALDDLSTRHESELAPKPMWTREKMAPGQYEALRDRIRAFALVPDRLEAIIKISQNRSPEARAGVIEGLERRGRANDLAIAQLMRSLEGSKSQ